MFEGNERWLTLSTGGCDSTLGDRLSMIAAVRRFPLLFCGDFVPQGASWARSGVSFVVEHDLAVDDHVFDPRAVLERIGVRGAVDHAVRVEHRQIGEASGTQETAISNAELGGAERSHFADGVFEPQQASLAHVHAQHARKGAEVARMRMAQAQRAFRGVGRAIPAPDSCLSPCGARKRCRRNRFVR